MALPLSGPVQSWSGWKQEINLGLLSLRWSDPARAVPHRGVDKFVWPRSSTPVPRMPHRWVPLTETVGTFGGCDIIVDRVECANTSWYLQVNSQ